MVKHLSTESNPGSQALLPINTFRGRRIKLSPDVLFQLLRDESVLLDLNNEQYIGLDPVATRIWQLLTENGDVEDVVKKMLQEYDVDEARLYKDLASFIADLSSQGLVEVEPEP